jgi:PhnB protein
MLYVPDADALAEQAVAAGAEIVRPAQHQFYRDRSGVFLDPFGYRWTRSTHFQDVTAEKMKRRLAAMGAPVS